MRKLSTITILSFLFSLFVYSQVDNQYALKAAFVYNFTKYISWKDTTKNDRFVIGVYGDSGIYKELNELKRIKKVSSKIIEVDKFAVLRSDAYRTINYCDILYIPKEHSKYAERIIPLADENTLIIGEEEGFIKKGGAINFVNIDNRLRFEFNKKELQNKQFKVSPQLLKIAIVIE